MELHWSNECRRNFINLYAQTGFEWFQFLNKVNTIMYVLIISMRRLNVSKRDA